MQIIKNAFWFCLAVLFLIETWLWNHMAALIKRIVAAIPLEATKAWIIAKVEPLSPWPTLLVFLIPVVILEPFKLVGLWLFAKGHIISGGLVFLAAKIIGLGVIAFLFETCKPKLMRFKIIAFTYDKCIQAKNWAKREIAPTLERIQLLNHNLNNKLNHIRETLAKYLPDNKGLVTRIIRRIKALRRKMS